MFLKLCACFYCLQSHFTKKPVYFHEIVFFSQQQIFFQAMFLKYQNKHGCPQFFTFFVFVIHQQQKLPHYDWHDQKRQEFTRKVLGYSIVCHSRSFDKAGKKSARQISRSMLLWSTSWTPCVPSVIAQHSFYVDLQVFFFKKTMCIFRTPKKLYN